MLAEIRAFSVFLGVIIGAGIFGLPFTAMKSGFWVVIAYLFAMAVFAIIIHLFYAEVCLATEGKHRLPGYAKKYLNPFWEKIAFVNVLFSLSAGLIPYLIIGGDFLNSLFNPFFGGNAVFYSLLFFLFGAYLVFRGTENISFAELILLAVILIILAVFFAKALPVVNFGNFLGFNSKFLFFPYGVVLFSLWGSSVIPELKEILAKAKSKNKFSPSLRKIIFWGIAAAAVIYAVFVFSVLGVTGENTTNEAISGIGKVMGNNVARLGFILGLACCFTTFIAIADVLKKTLWYDFGLSKKTSWAVTCFAPLIIFLIGVREFLPVISFIGAVSIGLEAIIIIFLYRAAQGKKYNKNIGWLAYLLLIIFALGIIFEVSKILF